MTDFQKNHFNNKLEYSKDYDFSKDYRVSMMLNFLKSNLEGDKKVKVLDVGVGDGYMYKDFLSRVEIYGIDVADDLLVIAKKNGIKTQRCDLENEIIPFEDNFFDIIMCGETIEHVVNSDFLLSEVNRVLKNGGKLILSYPNINTILGWIMLIFFDLPPMYSARFRSPHVRDWTKKTILKALHEFGFEVKKIKGSNFYVPYFRQINFLRISHILPRLASNVVVEAEKNKIVKFDKYKSIIC